MWQHRSKQISIPEFYENKSILITGATGFLGRLLTEKLLRSCPGINKIYVILRPKKGKDVIDRIKDITDIPVFDKLRSENREALNKIIPIAGDTGKLNLGLSENDIATIIENVSIFFHSAASVRFDDHLKKAILLNTRGAQEAILLAKQLKKCDVFVDVSTAYCNSDYLNIEEKLYPAKMNWHDAIRLAEECDERTLEIFTQKFIYPMPNTYTFTKALAEQAVVELSKDKIPAVIARPTIVIATYAEPFPGWLDNMNGATGIFLGVARGVVTSIHLDPYSVYNNVCADNVIKALIISSWKKAISDTTNEVDIFNIASDMNYSMNEIMEEGIKYTKKYPVSFYMQPPSMRMLTNYYIYVFWTIFGQILPSLLVDGIFILNNKKPMMYKLQCKIYNAIISLSYFMFNSWTFVNEKYLELPKCLLPEDAADFSIYYFGPSPSKKVLISYLLTYFNGIRTHLGNEPPPSEATIKKDYRLKLTEKIFKILCVFSFLYYLFFKYHIVSVIFDNIYEYLVKL